MKTLIIMWCENCGEWSYHRAEENEMLTCPDCGHKQKSEL